MTAEEWNTRHPGSHDGINVKWTPKLDNPRHWVLTKTTSVAFEQEGAAVIKVAFSKHPVPLVNVVAQ